MSDADPPEAGTGGPAVTALVDRLQARADDIGRRLVERYRADIVDYRSVRADALADEVLPTAVRNVHELLDSVRSDRPLDDRQLDRFREAAVRRVHQNVSVQSVLRAYRLWGQVVWDEVARAAATPIERDAALRIASRVMAHVDQVSAAVAQAYLDEASGAWRQDEGLRRDLLEALLSGRPLSPRWRAQAEALQLDLARDHLVVLVRRAGGPDPSADALRSALEAARRYLRPAGGRALIAVRDDEVVALYPASDAAAVASARRAATTTAQALPTHAVGVGRAHDGATGVGRSYAEAREAATYAAASGVRERALTFPEMLLEHVLRTSPSADALLEETVEPLRAYDEQRGAHLLHTLRVYVASRFHLTRSAEQLMVQPNTVVHRLRRIATLTGHDPNETDGLLLLALGVRLDAAPPLPTAAPEPGPGPRDGRR